jgi:hypothetical protein
MASGATADAAAASASDWLLSMVCSGLLVGVVSVI